MIYLSNFIQYVLNIEPFMCPLINLMLYILVFIFFKHYSFWHLCIIFLYTLWFLYILELCILSYTPFNHIKLETKLFFITIYYKISSKFRHRSMSYYTIQSLLIQAESWNWSTLAKTKEDGVLHKWRLVWESAWWTWSTRMFHEIFIKAWLPHLVSKLNGKYWN